METKKYIIEIPDNTAWLQWVKVSDKDGHVYFDFKDPEDLMLYTEPNLDAVRKEAYDKGYQDATVKIGSDEQAIAEKAYQKGLNDAWDAARKIFSMDGEVRETLLHNCFFKDIIENISASEAIEKIRQHEQEQKDFKVGDEVISDEDIKGVTVDMDDYLLHVLDENGVIQAWPREDAVKTGRYFPEIAEMLRKMREKKE